MEITNVVRLVLATGVLAFAGIADLRWRRAPDACWWTLGLAGAGLLAWDWLQEPGFLALYQPFLIVAGAVMGLALIGYLTGLIGGGADAKAIMSLAILFPLPLDPSWTLPLASPFPLVLSLLMNALLVALAVPLFLALSNLVRGELTGWHMFLGFPVAVDRLDYRVVWPLEYVDEEGELHRAYSPRGVPIEGSEPEDFQAAGIEQVWVTPKVPFLVPLFFGVVLVMLVGDPVAVGLERLIG